ncbi:hypothetical protein GCM10011581_46260 [Saccharopolyspora subtropica]|uniref:Uncharacterized protein n=1 Tax=Saccharopolyspora thermophila TaxID=89367 RepID=A0A917NIL6_9PSEU|nr:hypothetical protein GCM10011581_46260 [Saccharopolyspora subtropica]
MRACGDAFPCLTLRLHATTYAERAGCRHEEWAVSPDERGECQVMRPRTFARIWDIEACRERIVPVDELPADHW